MGRKGWGWRGVRFRIRILLMGASMDLIYSFFG